MGQLWRRFKARCAAAHWTPAIAKAGLVLAGQVLWVTLKLPGAGGISWYSAALPLIMLMLRPIFEPPPEQNVKAKANAKNAKADGNKKGA